MGRSSTCGSGVLAVTPFDHAPAVPADDLEVVPLLVLTGTAVALVGAATARFLRRDLAVTA